MLLQGLMSGPPTHAEICARGGKCRSDRKLAAVKLNLQKAQAALIAKRADRAVEKPAPVQ